MPLHKVAKTSRLATTAFAAVLLLGTAGGRAAPPAKVAYDLPATPGTAGAPGSLALGLRVEGRTLLASSCASAPCVAEHGQPILLTDELDVLKSRFEPLTLVGGRRLVRAIVPSATRPDVAFEALVAPAATPGPARIVWASPTGFGSTGEGSGGRVLMDGATVYVGKLRRELTLCGRQETLLEPKRVDPTTLDLHRVAMHRLPASIRDAAPTLLATPASAPPLGSVLTVRGASVHDGASTALTDDDPATAWHETVKGDGKGEFVVFSAPKALPLERLSLLLHPEGAAGALETFDHPVSLWLTVDDATYRVAVPKTPNAARVEVVLPKPTATSCVALSIDRGEPRADGRDADIGWVEVEGVPAIPPSLHELADLVTLLDGEGPGLLLAETLLANAGARGAKALAQKLPTMADRGRGRAVDVLEATPCAAAAPVLATLAWDAAKPVTRRAREALDGCGAAAAPALAAAFAQGPDAAREILAERWAKLDPARALAPLLEAARTAPAHRRRTFRVALARVAGASAGRDAIAAWLSTAHATGAAVTTSAEPDPVVELARAIAPTTDVGPLVAPLAQALLAHAGATASFERRWLAAEPLAELARRGDAGALAWLRRLHEGEDRYLRARAVEVSGDLEALRPERVRALDDGDPRVRLAALVALRRGAGVAGATGRVLARLSADAWTYVRAAAAETLGESQGGGDVDVALAEATRDDMPVVRAAALRALVSRGARAQLPAIRKRAFDRGELVDVRGEAIYALGKLCDAASVDGLFELVKRGSGSDGAHALALSAILALGDLHPPDLAQRLASIDQTSLVVRDAVRRALEAKSTCK